MGRAMRVRNCPGIDDTAPHARTGMRAGEANSVRGVVRLLDVGGDATALGDVHALARGPLADLLGVRGAGRRGRGPSAAATGATADLAGVADVAAQGLAQGGGVLVVEVDLVRRAVETERDASRSASRPSRSSTRMMLTFCAMCIPSSEASITTRGCRNCSRAIHKTTLATPNGMTIAIAGRQRISGVALEDEAQSLQGEPRRVRGEARALVEHQRREMAGGDDLDVGRRRRRARRSSGRPCPSTCAATPKSIPLCSASTVFLAITERGRSSSTLRSCAPRRPSASSEISMPGAMAPPMYWPLRAHHVEGGRGRRSRRRSPGRRTAWRRRAR